MRPASFLLVGLAALGACTAQPDRVSATPPTISYRVSGSDMSQTNFSASRYCQRYGTGAQYHGLQQTPSGNVAVYDCAGPMAATAGSTMPSEPSAADVGPATECGSFLHQDRPGGSDYAGPPGAACSSAR
jgi:hypothetical protein